MQGRFFRMYDQEQLNRIEKKLDLLIKQEEPKIKEIPEYIKLFEEVG